MSNENQVSPEQEQFDFGGCVGYIVENGVFLLGMLIMFSKTVDLMSAFAPASIMGYKGIESYYGLACGLLVEGALFVMKLLLPRSKNVFDWLWNAIVVIAPFIISALAQVFDSFLVRETLSSQPAEVQLFVTWFVPSIPTVIMALMIGKAIVSSIPKEIMPKGVPVIRGNAGKAGMGFNLGEQTEKIRRWWKRVASVPVENPTPASIKKDQTK